MKYTYVIAALLSSTKAQSCSSVYMEAAAENKIKATSQLEVAETLITVANKKRDEAQALIAPAKQALIDFEATVTDLEYKNANAKYTQAVAEAAVPQEEFDAWSSLTEARMETLTAAHKTYTSNEELLAATTSSLNAYKKGRALLTDDQTNEIIEADEKVDAKQIQVNNLAADVATSEDYYERAGASFQAADKQRAAAEQKLAVALAAQAEAKAALDLVVNGTMAAQASQQRDLSAAVAKAEEQYQIAYRDSQRAYLSRILATERKAAAVTAFTDAEATCGEFAGNEDPGALAMRIAQAQLDEQKEIDLLNEEDRKAKAYIDFHRRDYFDCSLREKDEDGQALSVPVRPNCYSADYCCGSTSAAKDGHIMEICMFASTTSTVEYEPPRAKNATKRTAKETLDFTCIEGASQVAASAAALLASVYMMA